MKLEAQFPEATSEAAQEGTRLHSVASGVLKGTVQIVSVEDEKVVGPYLENVRATVAARPRGQLWVEEEAFWSRLPYLRGTPDAVLVDFDNRHVIVWDLKTGWRLVEVLENWQLICYALMHARPGWTYELRIVQPLPYHPDGAIRSWFVDWETLRARGGVVFDAVEEILRGDGPLQPGKHCLYCDALVGCPAAREVSFGAVEYTRREAVELPAEYLARELSVLREALRILDLRVDALEETIAARVRGGESIPGVYMKENRRGGRLNWKGDEDQIRATLTMLTGKDPAVPKLPTPTQLKDKGIPMDLLRPLTEYKPGKMVVSTEADEIARKAFADAPNLEHTR